MGLNISSFVRVFVVAVFGVVCASGGAFAANCNPGQYYECGEDPYDNSCTECECVSCPAGQTSDGSGELYYCPNIYPTSPYGDSGCSDILCSADYVDCPAGVGAPGQRCKELTDACPSGSGCHEYELCNLANGALTYAVTGSCHIEEVSMCQPNTVSCNTFPIMTTYVYYAVTQNDQTGNATWNGYNSAWDTINCKLNSMNKSVSTFTVGGQTVPVHCDDLNVVGVVSAAYQFFPRTVFEPVYYNLTRFYCEKCQAGYLPNIQSSPNAGANLFPEGYDGAYGVLMCDEQVRAPYYAPGCMIPYPLNSSSMPDVCRVSCPDRMETIVNGATDDSYCLPKGAPVYEDDSGSFRLGTEMCN